MMVQRRKESLIFAISGIWQQPTDHTNNSFFCMTDLFECRSSKDTPAIIYPDLSSTAKIPHDLELAVPTPPKSERKRESNPPEAVEIIDPDFQMQLKRETLTTLSKMS